jgi:hypothetical protein
MSQNIYTPSPSNIFYIDPVYLKQHTSLNNNVDDKLILEAIQTAQDMYILPIVGNGIYKQIEFEISAGTIVSDTNYYFLLTNFLQPCLAASTMMHLLPFIEFQFKNRGVVTQKSEFSEPAKREDVEWIIEKYREKAAFYAQRTTQFLVANPDIFENYLNPQLGTNGNGADLYYPNQSSYTGGIFLPNLAGNNPGNGYRGYGLSLSQYVEMVGLG